MDENPANQGGTSDSKKLEKLEKEMGELEKRASAELKEQVQKRTQQASAQNETSGPVSQAPSLPNIPPEPKTQWPSEEKAAKSKKIMSAAVALLLISVIGAGAYYFFVLRPETVAIPVETPRSETTQTVDPIAGWETYEEEVYGYRIKHPSSWGTKVLGISGDTLIIAPQEIINTLPDGGFGGGSFLTISINSSNKPFNTPEADGFQSVGINPSVLVGGVDGLHYTLKILREGPGFEIGDVIETVFFSKGKTYYKMDLLDAEYNEIFFQTLSTFEFLETSPSPSPTTSPTASPSGTPVSGFEI